MPDKIVNHFVLADGSTARLSKDATIGYNDDLFTITGKKNLINNVTWTNGSYIKGDGTIGTNSSYKLSSALPVSSGTYTLIYTNTSAVYLRVWCYDSTDAPLSSGVVNTSGIATERVMEVVIPSNASTIRFSCYQNSSFIGFMEGSQLIVIANKALTMGTNATSTPVLVCRSTMSFNTANSTLTFPKPTYIFVGNAQLSYESNDIVLDYSSIAGNGVKIVYRNGSLMPIRAVDYNPLTDIVIFHFNKNSLNNSGTNDIFYPYLVDGVLLNGNEKGTTIYVDSVNGSDDNIGSQAYPFETIQKAVNANPDIIKVARGTYNETVTISGKNNLSILPTSTPNYSNSAVDVPMIIVNQVVCKNSYKIVLQDIHANNAPSGKSAYFFENINECVFINCFASNAEAGGFVCNKVNAKFVMCRSWNIGNETYPNADGFNFHHYGTTELIDCIAHDCYDDGVSHHDGCVCSIKGGEYYNNTHGGGIAPVNRYCEIDGAYCHDNAVGFETSSAPSTACALIKNSVMKNNTNYDITSGIGTTKVLRCTYDTKNNNASGTYIEI